MGRQVIYNRGMTALRDFYGIEPETAIHYIEFDPKADLPVSLVPVV